jgi:hypothetical protein
MLEDTATTGPTKSYVVTCPSAFRDAVTNLARRRGVSIADLARAVLLIAPAETIAAAADPGEPAAEDREEVVLQSGPLAQRRLRRKPRLQLRMAGGHEPESLRRALSLALTIDRDGGWTGRDLAAEAQAERRLERAEDEVNRLRLLVAALSFEPIRAGVRDRAEALHVLGFAPGTRPDRRTIKAKYRMLAQIFHPDSPYGDNERMAQINAAYSLLRLGFFEEP